MSRSFIPPEGVAGSPEADTPLISSAASLDAIFSAMAEGLVIHGGDGRIIAANPAAEHILGLSRDALLGKTSVDPRWQAVCEDGTPFPGDRHPAMVTLRTGRAQQGTIMGIDDPQRGRRWISVNASPVWGAERLGPVAVVAIFVDVTQRRHNEEQLAALSADLQDLYDNAPSGYHSLDAGGRFVRVNATLCGWLGCRPEDLLGKRSITDFMTEDGREDFKRHFVQFLASGRLEGLEFDLVGANGQARKVSVTATAVTDAAGRFIRSRSIVYDVSELQRSRDQLHRVNQEQSAILDNDLVAIVRLKGRTVSWVKRATQRIFGFEADELIGGDARHLYPNDGRFEHVSGAAHATLRAGGAFRSQMEMVRKGGERIWVDVSGVLLPGDAQESLWFLADITELKNYQESFERMAHLDSLTGLPNRVLLADRMEQALALAQRHQYWTAVCYLDLDGFKGVNDEHGHAAGDRLLKEVAQRIGGALRGNDTAARMGDDEFALLLTHVESSVEVERILARVLAQVALPVALDGGASVTVTASIGVALSPHGNLAPEELLRRSDAAMYAAKKLGKNQIHFYRDAPPTGVPSVH